MILTYSDVSKRYGGVQALNSVSLELAGGEIHALLGGNGSGKSTLIKITSGLVKADSGEVQIDGKAIDTSAPKLAKKAKIVSTAQELSILPNLSVAENLTICDLPKNGLFVDRKQMRSKAKAILERLGMVDELDTPVSALPINKQYLLEFGKAIYQDFDIILIDEITSALYREDVKTVKDILLDYKRQGKIILFVSHRMSEIFDICSVVTVMRNGEVISTYRTDGVTHETLLRDMVGESSAVFAAPKALSPEASFTGERLLSAVVPIKSYNETADFDVYKGEIIGVAGLQGHGQSDLVQALFGIDGEISVTLDGMEKKIVSPRSAVNNGIAYVTGDREKDGSFPQHDLADNIGAVSSLIFNKKIDTLSELKRFNIKFHSVYQSIVSLSGGNQQKVIFGRWISANPRLLLANDPSKGIDVNARAELREIIWELTQKGMSVVFVSSDEDELVSLCGPIKNSRILVMYEGKVVKTLVGAEITRENLIAATIKNGGGATHD